jgi:SAM-dependent methyltransferase
MFKTLVTKIDEIAEQQLPLSPPFHKNLISWSEIHGWDITDRASQRLLIRQALLNNLILQTTPGIIPDAFTSPLELLNVTVPSDLVEATHEILQRSHAASFNFWGEFYNTLIPQSRRRRIGQFWTNEQIADWMAAWLLKSQPHYLADVGCGAGNFLLKAAEYLENNDHPLKLYGCDLSPLLLNATLSNFQTRYRNKSSLQPELIVQNYLESALPPEVDAVICNPPYTRHHHIAPELKDKLQTFFKIQFRFDVSRQGTMAFYFLLKLIADMADGARAAVIVPMEVVDARYGLAAKRILCRQTTLTALIHFSPHMNAFRKVDVGASILLFKKGYQKQNRVRHLTLDTLPATQELLACLAADPHENLELPFGSLVIQEQDEMLEIPKWFSIATPPISNATWENSGLVVPLKTLAKVVRGIATGANKFFALPTQKVKRYSLESYVVRTLQRNREVQDIILDEVRWQTLSDEGKSVWLLYLNGVEVRQDPHLRAYLSEGEAAGYHQRSLVQTRKRWYMMEQRQIPPIFFTILTRGNPRFILNQAGVRPLNMFSLIYPNQYITEAGAAELLWVLLNSNFSLSRLHSVSRTYGGNTLKVEPRELDNLPVINPLALPEEMRQKIKGWIDDFYHHRQSSVLMRQIDALIERLLVSGITDKNRSPLPIQPRLLETMEIHRGQS